MYFLESIKALLAFFHNSWKDGDKKLFHNKEVQDEDIPFTIFLWNLEQLS